MNPKLSLAGEQSRSCRCPEAKTSGPCTACGKTAEPTAQVREVLASPGHGLDATTRAVLSTRFGRDLGSVRLHADARAAASARALGALAYTVGEHVVFADGAPEPTSASGLHLLAHELTHVLQAKSAQHDPGAPLTVAGRNDPTEREAHGIARLVTAGGSPDHPSSPSGGNVIHRFAASERGEIGTLDEIVEEARVLASRHMGGGKAGGYLQFNEFVRDVGGTTSVSDTRARLAKRYIFTCRCGLVDLRHFYQLMYISRTLWNRRATEMGRTHELESEPTSRFAAEDTPSNALGAFFAGEAEQRSAGGFAQSLADYLRLCTPTNFAAMAPLDQQTIVDYYTARDAAGVPVNQNETAVPAQLAVTPCTQPDRSFPFELASDDPDRKTISGRAAPYGLTSDTAIRRWVASQPTTTLTGLPSFEKTRLIDRLMNGWVSNEDLDAVERLYQSASVGEQGVLQALIQRRAAELVNDEQALRVRTLVGG